MQIYLVGGAVRDKLLGLPVKDRDWVVTGATAEEMANNGYKPLLTLADAQQTKVYGISHN